MVPAKFGSKSFEVSSKKIYTPTGISLSEELNIEETEVSGKKPTVSIKGVKLKSLAFELKLDARFVTVETELNYWENTLKGKKSQNFVLGKRTLGRFFLTKVEQKEYSINKNGVYTSAILSLSFTEDGAAVNKASTSTAKASSVKASGTTSVNTMAVGATVKPKSGTRWYYSAEGALKKTGKSGKAYQKNMTVKYVYKKNGKIVCVNPQGLGWMKVEDVTLIKKASTSTVKTSSLKKSEIVATSKFD